MACLRQLPCRSPVDVACLFHGETGSFGLFNERGEPFRTYHAVAAYHRLVDGGTPFHVDRSLPGRLVVAATYPGTEQRAHLLIAAREGAPAEVRLNLLRLPWPGASYGTLRIVDRDRSGERVGAAIPVGADGRVTVRLSGPSVMELELRPVSP